MKLSFCVLPFDYSHYRKYATMSNVVINNALTVVVDMLIF